VAILVLVVLISIGIIDSYNGKSRYEQLDTLSAALNGREVRCNTCGGHLGDVFNDGYIYVGTSSFKSGLRYCINGSALNFIPAATTTGTRNVAAENLETTTNNSNNYR